MTKSLRKKRKRKDLRIAKHAISGNVVQLPAYSVALWKAYRYKVIWGGRGATRSWTVARTLLLMGARKTLRILCAREIQASIKDSVHQLLKDQIDLLQIPGYLVTDREIRHENGTVFLFAGLRHNSTKIKSLEGIDICWVEEAERISKASWNILIPTIRKAGSEIWVTFNPDQESDATYQRFIIHPPAGTWSKKVNSDDNPWLSPELKAERDYAYATDPDAADHIWGGNIRRFSAAQVLRDKWVVEEFVVPYTTEQNGDVTPLWNGPYLAMDFGFGTDPFAAIKCWVYNRVLYIEREAYAHGLDIHLTPDFLTQEIPHFDSYVSRADSSRPDSISYLRQHGIPQVIGAKKGPGSVEDGVAHLRSYEKIIIHPRCRHTVDECKLWSYKVDPLSGDVQPVLVDKHNHLMDALRYALEPMIKPRRLAGFMFTQGDKIPICPTCSSYLPDSGKCPHCGALVDMTTGLLIDETELVIVSTNGNGNGNGNGKHHNGNGATHVDVVEDVPPPTRSRFLGLNG